MLFLPFLSFGDAAAVVRRQQSTGKQPAIMKGAKVACLPAALPGCRAQLMPRNFGGATFYRSQALPAKASPPTTAQPRVSTRLFMSVHMRRACPTLQQELLHHSYYNLHRCRRRTENDK